MEEEGSGENAVEHEEKEDDEYRKEEVGKNEKWGNKR